MTEADTAPVFVEARGLLKRFGSVVATNGVSLEIRQGTMFGLIGPDGAGKTTTLRMVLGLLRPDLGSVRTLGVDPYRDRRRVCSRIGYLSQRFSLYGDLSVDENIAFFAEIHDVTRYDTRRSELLEMVRMEPFRDRLADRLSGGMRQKLALVCTLIHTPELLVLDEPTTGVDPVSRRDFWRLLARLQRQGLTILLTTPYLDEAERCDRVALLDHGRVLTEDTPDALRAAEAGLLIEVVASPLRAAVEALRATSGVKEVEVFGERLHVRVDRNETEAVVRTLTESLTRRGIEVRSVRRTMPSLEDVFIGRIRQQDQAAAIAEVNA